MPISLNPFKRLDDLCIIPEMSAATDKKDKPDKPDKPEKIDYLEVDNPIAGQNYVCMSFLSPESLMQNKEGFKVAKFLQSYCKEQKLKFDEVYGKYQDFTYKYEDKLQRDFDEQNDFQTSLRGIKVRGVFDTREAAQARAKTLNNTDSAFHVFIGQMGYWLPWEPNADKIEDEHFQNTQLNDMMEKYQENNVNRDIFYEEQKRDKIKAAQEEVRAAKEEQAKEKAASLESTEGYDISDMEPEPEPSPDDPEPEPEPEQGSEGPTLEPEPSDDESAKRPLPGLDKDAPGTDQIGKAYEDQAPPASSVNKVDDATKAALESDDPWLARKKAEASQ